MMLLARILLPSLLVFAGCLAASYKILGFFPYVIRSHYRAFHPLMLELANRGHTVRVYTSFPSGIKSDRYVEVDCSACFQKADYVNNDSAVDIESRTNCTSTVNGLLIGLRMIFRNVRPTADMSRRCQPILELLTGGEQFDAAFGEIFNSHFNLALIRKLNVTASIAVHSSSAFPWMSWIVANAMNPSYTPNLVPGYLAEMSFTERVCNTFGYVMCLLRHSTDSLETVRQAVRQFPVNNDESVEEAARNISLLFLYSHFTINPNQPYVPAVVEIGGISVRKLSALPQDIEKFINGSEHGVIYFCMGSLLRGSSFPEDKRKAFLYAFSKIPQRVLWKWEGDNLPGKPDNVMIAKWMPQRDILAHPNVKLFISHGGLLGTNEAVYEGVPILGIPIFGDQRTNVKSIEASGAGELLDYNDISDEVVFGKIQKLLHDPKYRENAKELSRRYRDRPMSPLDTAVYWTEYVIRHKGAHHLRSAAVDLPWYQYLLLDVIAFVLLVLVVSLLSVYYSIKFTLRFIFRKLFGKKQPTKSEKSKKKLN